MTATKILLAANDATIGTVSPYSYQVKPKIWNRESGRKQIVWGGEARASHLTKGAGKGQATRFYIYFMEDAFQHWVELTETAWKSLSEDASKTLSLVRKSAELAVEAIVEAELEAPRAR